MYDLSECYEENLAGIVLPPKTLENTALYWLHRAAELGHPQAQYEMGNLYENGGLGLPHSISDALKWHEKAMAQGHELARKAIEILQLKIKKIAMFE